MDKKNNKTKMFVMRFTPDEYEELKKLAINYSGKISHLIRIAIRQFNDRRARKKFEIVDEYIKYWQENENELRRIGANLNQTMKRMNELNAAGLLDANDMKGMMNNVEDVRTKLYEYIRELDRVSRKLLR